MIEPKRNELAAAVKLGDEANTKLKAVQDKVADLNAMVADLERQFDEANKEKSDALAEQAAMERKLGLANRLVNNALQASGEQWAKDTDRLRADYTVLTGDVLLASAFVSYGGPFTAPFRHSLITDFREWLGEAKGADDGEPRPAQGAGGRRQDCRLGRRGA